MVGIDHQYALLDIVERHIEHPLHGGERIAQGTDAILFTIAFRPRLSEHRIRLGWLRVGCDEGRRLRHVTFGILVHDRQPSPQTFNVDALISVVPILPQRF
jgi:hypothetical protein